MSNLSFLSQTIKDTLICKFNTATNTITDEIIEEMGNTGDALVDTPVDDTEINLDSGCCVVVCVVIISAIATGAKIALFL